MDIGRSVTLLVFVYLYCKMKAATNIQNLSILLMDLYRKKGKKIIWKTKEERDKIQKKTIERFTASNILQFFMS